MNLTALFAKDAAIRDAAIVDHEWMRDGIVHPGEPHLDLSSVRKHNNIKPELELQWGLGGPDIDLDEPAGMVKRTLPEDAGEETSSVILFARDMMNRGKTGKQVVAALKAKFAEPVLRRAKNEILSQFSLDGIVGRVAVDGRGYKNCKQAMEAAANSPYKGFIKYVIGCQCGDPHMIPARHGTNASAKSSGNPVDDFMASSDGGSKTVMVAHCRSTHLPILAARGDFDPSDMDTTFTELMNVTGLPGDVAQGIMDSDMAPVAKLKAAFRWLDKRAANKEAARYTEKVDASEFRVKHAEQEVDFIGVPMPDVDVNPAPLPLDEVELNNVVEGDVAPMSMPNDLEVDMSVPESPDVEIEGVAPLSVPEDMPLLESLDVEMDQALEPEFEGTGEVMIDEPSTLMDEIVVNMMPGPDDEDEFLASGDKKAMEFPTQDAMKKYLDEHPDADKSNHKVVEKKDGEKKFGPAKAEQFIKDYPTTERKMKIRNKIKGLGKDLGLSSEITPANILNALAKYFHEKGKSKGWKMMKDHDLSEEDVKFFADL